MDGQRFDWLAQQVTEIRTRRGALQVFAAALFGASAAAIAEHDADAKKRRRRRHRRKGGGGKTPENQCPAASVCNTEPNVCGSVAGGGGECTCERSVEGNNVCVNSGAGCPTPLVECTSTSGSEATSCRNLVGFHFFCQENKTNGSGVKCGCGQTTTTGRVCMPECDNPS